jgi:type III pantothenate kinase
MKLVAVDIGNSAIKWSVVERDSNGEVNRAGGPEEMQIDWDDRAVWWIASVNQIKCQDLKNWLAANRPLDRHRELNYRDIGLRIELPYPQRVGIDRLCAALAAQRRAPRHPCIVIDAGTAITIDAVSAEGTFLGGTIFLGPQGALDYLAQATDALPKLDLANMPRAIDGLGTSTELAMLNGVILSAAAGIDEIVRRQIEIVGEGTRVFITGGTALALHKYLRTECTSVEPLVLEGIATVARRLAEVHA